MLKSRVSIRCSVRYVYVISFTFYVFILFQYSNPLFITFEIKRRSHGMAQVILISFFHFLLIQKTFEIKRRSHCVAQVIQLTKLSPYSWQLASLRHSNFFYSNNLELNCISILNRRIFLILFQYSNPIFITFEIKNSLMSLFT